MFWRCSPVMFLFVGLFEVFLKLYEVTGVRRAQQTLEQVTEFQYMYMLKMGKSVCSRKVVR